MLPQGAFAIAEEGVIVPRFKSDDQMVVEFLIVKEYL